MAKGYGARGMAGMGGGMNMNMIKQAQKMQQDMLRMQQELQEKEYEAKAGGGVVAATVNGKHELKNLVIDPEAVDPDDVEMLHTLPEKSDEAFDELVMKAENLVKGLGFHFRTVKLAAGDCSASMARTYDIEINIPSMNGYKEVSSVSNARDYQARRGMMRVRRADGRIEYLHTLNGSGLATSRILPALVEQNQNADGSVNVPDVLKKYLGCDVIKK